MVPESTGGLELPLAGALAASLPVAVVNPRRARDFARATGRLAKTDAPDARVLAHFAEAVRPEIRQGTDADTHGLRSLNARRTQAVEMPVAERNRPGCPPPHPLPHRVAVAGTERPGLRAAGYAAPKPGMAGAG